MLMSGICVHICACTRNRTICIHYDVVGRRGVNLENEEVEGLLGTGEERAGNGRNMKQFHNNILQ